MTTYEDAGVNIAQGDKASAIAYTHAKSTFSGRSGRIGEPVIDDGGFAGMLDMGDYYLLQADDSTGSKIDIALETGIVDTIGQDLLCMVCDDIVCTGAEVISVSNTMDLPTIEPKLVDQMMQGHARACLGEQIVIPGGEVAEVPGAVTRGVWSATAVGILEKDKVIDPGTIQAGDAIIALQSDGLRCNGYSLVRKILSDTKGNTWTDNSELLKEILTPSKIYHSAVLKLVGRYQEQRMIEVKGIAHITGGGIAGNLARVLKKSGCGAVLDALFEPHEIIEKLIEWGSVPIPDAYATWNMGNGMLIVVHQKDAENTLSILEEENISAKIAGAVTDSGVIDLRSHTGESLALPLPAGEGRGEG